MKAFIISLLLFLLLIGCIILNTVFLNRSADHFRALAMAIETPENRRESLEELAATWEKQKKWIGLTVSFRELDHFGEIITQLHWAYEQKNEQEFQKYRSLFLDAIEEITRTERFSIENLF